MVKLRGITSLSEDIPHSPDFFSQDAITRNKGEIIPGRNYFLNRLGIPPEQRWKEIFTCGTGASAPGLLSLLPQ
jgi:hypothetical protein